MKVISFIYHDVVTNARYDESGFPGAGPARYKLSPENFELHLNELERGTKRAPVIVGELERQPVEVPWLLTFDDGGASAVWIGENLAQRDWRGHFFITVDWIGKPGFVDKDGIRGLESMGHVIGSHSCSHPEQMARCSRDELLYEWGRSTEVLSEIIGRPVDLASVPGGYYSSARRRNGRRRRHPGALQLGAGDLIPCNRRMPRAGQVPGLPGHIPANRGRPRLRKACPSRAPVRLLECQTSSKGGWRQAVRAIPALDPGETLSCPKLGAHHNRRPAARNRLTASLSGHE